MAEQATGTVEGTGTAGALAHGSSHMEHNPGRPISWVGTSIANPDPDWIVFWIGAGVAIVGLLILSFSKAMSTDWY